ncbi:hypothetical protein H920_14361 [Fukomys damarensis]|uniref:Uncharacterized protein n=1 Tax=Fukomys damarensis TaxID=885580 RepID=A0A091DN81_FUKDA|nr:hypothetical protein H920_14361 [Fukomys damarensis]
MREISRVPLTTGQGHTRARAAALHQLLKQTRPRSLPLSPTPLKIVSPAPAPAPREASGKPVFPDHSSEETLFNLTRAESWARETGRPSLPTRGSSVSNRPRPAPHPGEHRLRPEATKGQARSVAASATQEQERPPFSADSRSLTFFPSRSSLRESPFPSGRCFVSEGRAELPAFRSDRGVGGIPALKAVPSSLKVRSNRFRLRAWVWSCQASEATVEPKTKSTERSPGLRVMTP